MVVLKKKNSFMKILSAENFITQSSFFRYDLSRFKQTSPDLNVLKKIYE